MHRLGKRLELENWLTAFDHACEADPIPRGASRSSRFSTVGMMSMSRTIDGTRRAATPGRARQERHAHHALVEKHAVIALAVVAEGLAVVPGHEHDRGGGQLPAFECSISLPS